MGSPWSVALLRHAEFRMHAPQGPRSRIDGSNQNTVCGEFSVFRIVPYFLHHAQIVVGRPGEMLRVDGVVDVVEDAGFTGPA